MDRVERCEKNSVRLFGVEQNGMLHRDPELMRIFRRVALGDVHAIGDLDDRLRELVTITVLVTTGNLPQLATHLGAALNVGVSPLEVREAIYQCAPFAGYPAALNALDVFGDVCEERFIALPLRDAATTVEGDRMERGRSIQEGIYGTAIRSLLAPLPDGLGDSMADLLTGSFGDFYTREGLDVATRELLVLCMFVALGDMPNQIRSHSLGNLRVGNSKAQILAAMIQCVPYVGFPRVLNAVRLVIDLPEDDFEVAGDLR